jgi:acyl-CoA thioesterase-1
MATRFASGVSRNVASESCSNLTCKLAMSGFQKNDSLQSSSRPATIVPMNNSRNLPQTRFVESLAARRRLNRGRSLALVVWASFALLFNLKDVLGQDRNRHDGERPAEQSQSTWKYEPELLRPFWQGTTMEGESVLFSKNPETGAARASVLFPIRDVVAIRNSVGDVTYEQGKDYDWKPDSREITLPAGSRIPSRTPDELRRPANSQKYALTHRDGNGEIFFGARLEYAEMQTVITYRHAPDAWNSPVPKFNAQGLPHTFSKLTSKEPLSIVLLGDSISTGANASGIFDAAPFQPAYPELVRAHLERHYQGKVTLENLSVGGTDTPWALGMIDKAVALRPNLMIVAFGMNDAAGRSANEYQENVHKLIGSVRERLPECEFILVAPMLGNPDWTRLKHELFPQYRDKLKELTGPGIVLADLTSMWTRFLELKRDWDQTGNGVNHPNDFGHRVYAQVIAALLIPPDGSPAAAEPLK